jgi:hypothetical protein
MNIESLLKAKKMESGRSRPGIPLLLALEMHPPKQAPTSKRADQVVMKILAGARRVNQSDANFLLQ